MAFMNLNPQLPQIILRTKTYKCRIFIMVYVRLAFAVAVVIGADLLCLVRADNECEVGYELFQESCYRLSDSTAAREDAAAACTPGHLVDITSEGERNFIDGLLTTNMVDYAWFGLLKSLSWSDGSSLVHESWQEILADEDHRCFLLEQPFKNYYRWNDIGCDEEHKSICEYEISGNEGCRSGFKKFNRSCYQINTDTLNGTDAAAACSAELAHLVDITSEEEHQYLGEMLTLSGGGVAWIGLTFSDPPYWSDGSLLSPGNWYNIITDGNSVCYRLRDQRSEGQGYVWDDPIDTSCRGRYRYVCENEVTSLSSTITIPEYTTPSTNSMSISTTSMTDVTSLRTVTVETTNPTMLNLTGNPASSSTGAIIGLSLGIVIVVIIFVTGFAIVIIYFRREITTAKHGENNLTDLKTTTTQPSQQDPDQVPDYQNVSNPDKSTESETYIGLDQTSRQPESMYQGMTDPNELKSTDDYLSLDVNSSSKTDAEYQSLSDNAMLGNKKTDQDLIYHEISENKADQYDYAYANPTEVFVPNMEVQHTYFYDPNKNPKDVYVNSNIHVRKS